MFKKWQALIRIRRHDRIILAPYAPAAPLDMCQLFRLKSSTSSFPVLEKKSVVVDIDMCAAVTHRLHLAVTTVLIRRALKNQRHGPPAAFHSPSISLSFTRRLLKRTFSSHFLFSVRRRWNIYINMYRPYIWNLLQQNIYIAYLTGTHSEELSALVQLMPH